MVAEIDITIPANQRAVAGEPGWLIVETHPQMERKAADELRRAGLKAYMPQVSWTTPDKRTKEPKVKRRPLMRGYLFARLTAGAYRDLSDLWGVKRVVKYPGTDRPFMLRHQIVAAFIRAERRMEHEAEKDRIWRMGRRRGHPGTISRAVTQAIIGAATRGSVVTGPYIGQELEIVGATDAGKVQAKVLMMGKEAVAEFEPLVEIVPMVA